MSPRMARYKARPMADGGVTGVQAQDESFNKNLRDASTDLGDISGTNSRRAMEYLGEGNTIENQANAYSGQYYNDYGEAKDDTQAELGRLQQTPGYTSDESAQINQDFGKYRTSEGDLNQRFLTQGEQGGITGNVDAAGVAATGMGKDIFSTLGTTGQQAQSAISGEKSDTGGALGGEKAAVSDFASRYRMTPQQQQDIVTAAGTTVGNQYRSAQSDLDRAAAASGNTSPLAIAAAKKELADSSAAQMGDAMTNARIEASNAAAGRETGILGAEQNLGTQQINTAETVGQQGVSEADTSRAASLSGIEAGGQAAIGTSEYADTSASQRAAELAGNRQQTTADIQNTQYTQGVQTGSLTSQGAQTVGNARRQGQQAYIGGEQQQQQMGETGQLQSKGQQIGAYGTKMSGANQAENNAITATGDTRGQGIGDKASSGLGSFIGSLEDGGIVGNDDPAAQMPEDAGPGVDGNYDSTKPGLGTRFKNALTDQMMNRYNPSSGSTDPNPMKTFARQEVAQGVGALAGALHLQGGAAYVKKPTLAIIGERAPEMVVPLNRTPSTKLPAATLKTAASAIPRYRGMRPAGAPNLSRPMPPMGGSLDAR